MTEQLASKDDMGINFGGELYEFEIKYLIRHEWARSAEDVLWRRTNLGLLLSSQEADVLQTWMEKQYQ